MSVLGPEWTLTDSPIISTFPKVVCLSFSTGHHSSEGVVTIPGVALASGVLPPAWSSGSGFVSSDRTTVGVFEPSSISSDGTTDDISESGSISSDVTTAGVGETKSLLTIAAVGI